MKRRGFIGKLLMGAAATALAPIAAVEPKKITQESVERVRIGVNEYKIWPGTPEEISITSSGNVGMACVSPNTKLKLSITV